MNKCSEVTRKDLLDLLTETGREGISVQQLLNQEIDQEMSFISRPLVLEKEKRSLSRTTDEKCSVHRLKKWLQVIGQLGNSLNQIGYQSVVFTINFHL